MPNCDFYATYEDHKQILDYIFEESLCDVYELSSDFGKPLKQFFSSGEVLKEFSRHYPNGNKWCSVYLQLSVLDSSPKFEPTKVSLDPKQCDGYTFRYTANGFGLIQLYLELPNKNVLKNSHTNHNSKKRAETWAGTKKEIDEVALIDFDKISLFSSNLNRFIRKQSIGKLQTRPVLPHAYDLKNIDFDTHKSGEYQITLK